MDVMQKIDLNNLDKSNWQTYRFDEIAKSISERIDPNNTDLEVYIGLEHIDPESIHIKRMGKRDDVNGQKLRCYPGDVIFGRRRAYQRKAAVATFDGFCSAHSLVLRANPEVIDPKLFPFFIHSNAFMHRAIDISVGSLSPTINWGTLKHQEFLLPPKDQQAQLAELLWAMDDVTERDIDVLGALNIALEANRKEGFDDLDGELIKVAELILPMSKIKVGKVDKSEYMEQGKYPVIDQSQTFISGYTDNVDLIYEGDLPVIVFGDHTAILKYINFPFVMGADGTKVIKPNGNLDVKYLFHALINLDIQTEGYKRHYSILREKKIKVCSNLNISETLVHKLDELDGNLKIAAERVAASKSLQQSLINQVF